MGRFVPFLLWFALALYACIDCARTPRAAMPGRLAKPLWFLVIVLVPLGLGAVAWIVVQGAQRAEDRQAGVTRTPAQETPPRPRRRTGPLAPDDDPAFLAHLEQEARARRREQRGRQEPPHTSPAPEDRHAADTDESHGGDDPGPGRRPDDEA